MPGFSNPWFWVILVSMSVWSMYGLFLRDCSARPKSDSWFGALIGSPVYGRRTAVIAVAFNLAAAGMGLNAWLLAPTAHIYNLPLFHRFVIALWAVCLGRVFWAFHLIGKPGRRPSAANALAFWGYILLMLVVLMPLAM